MPFLIVFKHYLSYNKFGDNMKERIKGAIILLLVFVPVLLIGGITYKIVMYILSLGALYELNKARNVKLPNFLHILSATNMAIIIFNKSNIINLDIKIIIGIIMSFMIVLITYHNNKKYNIDDASFLTTSTILLGLSFGLMAYIRNDSIKPTIYLLSISTMTDSFALFTGLLFGKHKLIESISPKKTVEGLIGGTIFGVMLGVFVYYLLYNKFNINIVLITLFLSIIGQLGDLIFSSIKRNYKVKDFGNLIPGHGGILDRMDSIILIVLAFAFFIEGMII